MAGDAAAEAFACAAAWVRSGADDAAIAEMIAGGSETCPAAPTRRFLAVTEAPTTVAEEPAPLWPKFTLGVSGAAIAGGVLFVVLAVSARAEVDAQKARADPRAELESTQARGEAFALTADVMLIGGVVAAAIGRWGELD